MEFELHPNLKKKTFVFDLPLCRVLLEDASEYPWVFLVPRLPNISRIMDLQTKDQWQLMVELDRAQKIFWELFNPKQLNVAAIGNKTPQLHVHVIARREGDPAWPGCVWDHPMKTPYPLNEKEKRVELLATCFSQIEIQ